MSVAKGNPLFNSFVKSRNKQIPRYARNDNFGNAARRYAPVLNGFYEGSLKEI